MTYILILMLNCCGPEAIAHDVIPALSEDACHERGIAWIHAGEGRGFMCLRQGYAA